MRDDVSAAVARARTKYTVRKAPKQDVIESVVSPTEVVEQVLFGAIGSKAATLVLTDKAIYKLTYSNIVGSLGAANEVIPFAMLTGIDRGRIVMGEFRVTLTRAQNVDEVIHLDEQESEHFVAAVRDRMEQAQATVVNVVVQDLASDPLDQLRKLKDLHEAGVLTDAEYEAKRMILLDRI